MLISLAEFNQFGLLLLPANLEARLGPNVSQITIVKLVTFAGNSLLQRRKFVSKSIMLLMARSSSGIVSSTLW
jgi:hypothetical protein